MSSDAGLADLLNQAWHTSLEDCGGRAQALGDYERYVRSIDIIKTFCISRHDHLEVLVDLAAQHRSLFDPVTAVSCQQLDTDRYRVGRVLDQTKAVDRGPMNSRQIGVVGLVARIGGLAKLLGGER